MTAKGETHPEPYGSAMDLPSYQQLAQQVHGFKILTRVAFRKHRAEVATLEQELNRLAKVVDDFYDRLGARNWIFHEMLNVDEVEKLLSETSDAGTAEVRLIALYRNAETARWWRARLRGRDGFRQRAHLIERAQQHYEAGEFDSCVMHLVAVMDGFINDFDPGERRGLHSRDPSEMGAWDSVVGHHMGLTHAMETFTKTIKRRVDEEVFEVYRHGIMHGSVVHFNNEIVATKAWNMLFAIADWADATRKAAEPSKPETTWKEVWADIRRRANYERHERAFVPRTLTADHPEFDSDEVRTRASDFFDAWARKQWAIIAGFKPHSLRRSESEGETARHTKEEFGRFDLSCWSIKSITYDVVSGAAVAARATVNGGPSNVYLRMIFCDFDGNVALPGRDEGMWTVAIWAPHTYFTT